MKEEEPKRYITDDFKQVIEGYSTVEIKVKYCFGDNSYYDHKIFV